MSRFHLVRVGALGRVGRFRSPDATTFPRGTRVVVRTTRGLELGEIVAPPGDEPLAQADGTIVRAMTIEDQLLEARLLRHRDEAFHACQSRLEQAGADAVLVDVEHLFDGQSLFFYFLGAVPGDVDRLTEELAGIYDAGVQFSRFAETLVAGCGPACGTQDAEGSGCGSCSTGCSLAAACGTRP
jgi:cell fate regulator YaaT (PSP1 superfamily)